MIGAALTTALGGAVGGALGDALGEIAGTVYAVGREVVDFLGELVSPLLGSGNGKPPKV